MASEAEKVYPHLPAFRQEGVATPARAVDRPHATLEFAHVREPLEEHAFDDDGSGLPGEGEALF